MSLGSGVPWNRRDGRPCPPSRDLRDAVYLIGPAQKHIAMAWLILTTIAGEVMPLEIDQISPIGKAAKVFQLTAVLNPNFRPLWRNRKLGDAEIERRNAFLGGAIHTDPKGIAAAAWPGHRNSSDWQPVALSTFPLKSNRHRTLPSRNSGRARGIEDRWLAFSATGSLVKSDLVVEPGLGRVAKILSQQQGEVGCYRHLPFDELGQAVLLDFDRP